ncbi:MAG: MurR/RpiR family transcriptional regulator [Clostridia bacterium]|jgi:DNA-binding MurR/RpiR family transcriptional regulator|nr:MurR/RpiR family transcriptional regulator [Clostridia bacterium]
MKRDLLSEIESGMSGFSKAQRTLATYILEHYDRAAYLTAAKLGREANISESTVVRFAIELGFSGYPEMQKELRKIIRSKLTSVQRVEITDALLGDGDVIDRVLGSDAEKIAATLSELDREAFSAAVDQIVNAGRIYIIGVRSSAFLAGFLNFNLRMIFDNISFVQTTSGSEMFEQIMGIGADDVLIAVSFPRYSSRIINAVEFAHESGADVISITDGPQSPIAALADQLLVARSDMVSYIDSLVAPLSIINAIIVAVARKLPDRVRDRLKKLEAVWKEYEVYEKKDK